MAVDRSNLTPQPGTNQYPQGRSITQYVERANVTPPSQASTATSPALIGCPFNTGFQT